MNKLVLIDGDILYNKAAFSCEDTFDFSPDHTVRSADSRAVVDLFHHMLTRILDTIGTTRFLVCWTSTTNFRHDVDPTYKQQRANARRPVVNPEVVNCFKSRYPSTLINHLEADDVMGLLSGPGTIIASDDKDMRTIPGQLYIPRKPGDGVIDISEEDADYFWLKQTLMGDRTDGYSGIPGVGEKKSEKYLREYGPRWGTVVQAYQDNGLSEEDALRTARLARILRPGEWSYTLNKPILWSPEHK